MDEYSIAPEMGDDMPAANPVSGGAVVQASREPDRAEKLLVSRLASRIRADKSHHRKAFKAMTDDMQLARRGAPKDWPEDSYVANITGRHINQKTAALYAKNPKATARRRPRLDFAIWDEQEASLQMAFQTIQMYTEASAGNPMLALQPPPPEVQQAMAVMQDFQQGMEQRQKLDKIGKTLEILFDYYMKAQRPVDFKVSMKQLVRRAATCGVAYLKIGFQREYEQDLQVASRLEDFRGQLMHIKGLQTKLERGESNEKEADERELQHAIESLQSQEFVLLREGLVYDFPESTRVIPDQTCRSLVGFVGSRHLTVEYLYKPDEVSKIFDVDLGARFTPYTADGKSQGGEDQPSLEFGREDGKDSNEFVCVWEHYDKDAGQVYYMADGYHGFLRAPAPPDVYVETFWPIFALTFNEVEDPESPFPPSDVRLMADMQAEYNRSRQGMREHRRAARPRFIAPRGALSDEDKVRIGTLEPFEVMEANIDFNTNIAQVLQAMPMPGVDPNLYETGQLFTDIQLVIGSQEAQFGGVSKATATEASIAEGSREAGVGSNVDDLDAFLTDVARASGQVLLREMSQEKVVEIAGPGAYWPQMTLDQIADELYLEIEAGSSGKPNQAQEIRNWREMLPFLVQMPGIQPMWLARETLRRLDDRMDLTDAIAENVPAIVALNRMAQPMTGEPQDDPTAQGAEGANNGPAAPGVPTGSTVPGGNNQQRVM
jgi:hypothetical protein